MTKELQYNTEERVLNKRVQWDFVLGHKIFGIVNINIKKSDSKNEQVVDVVHLSLSITLSEINNPRGTIPLNELTQNNLDRTLFSLCTKNVDKKGLS